jgi:NAD(P)H-dependent FMN reductase
VRPVTAPGRRGWSAFEGRGVTPPVNPAGQPAATPYPPGMSETQLKVLLVVGSLREGSASRTVLATLSGRLQRAGCATDLLDLAAHPLALYNPDTAYDDPGFPALKARVEQADVLVLGTPDYHGSISSPLKNFLDHFWHEFAGKLFATLVASHEKGLTVTDQLRTIARQCQAWTLPYGVAFMDGADVRDDQILSTKLLERLDMLVRDLRVYGSLLARQRLADLAGAEPGFLGRQRKAG